MATSWTGVNALRETSGGDVSEKDWGQLKGPLSTQGKGVMSKFYRKSGVISKRGEQALQSAVNSGMRAYDSALKQGKNPVTAAVIGSSIAAS